MHVSPQVVGFRGGCRLHWLVACGAQQAGAGERGVQCGETDTARAGGNELTAGDR